jgi:hypothetical protein
MLKKSLALGIVSGLLAGIAGVIYAHLYYTINEADFSKVASTISILAASLFGGVLAAIGIHLAGQMAQDQGRDRLQPCVYPDQLYLTAGPDSGKIAPEYRYAGTIPRNGHPDAFFPGAGVVHPETFVYKE